MRLHRDIAGNLGLVDAVAGKLWGIRDLGAHEFQDTDRILGHGLELPLP